MLLTRRIARCGKRTAPTAEHAAFLDDGSHRQARSLFPGTVRLDQRPYPLGALRHQTDSVRLVGVGQERRARGRLGLEP